MTQPHFGDKVQAAFLWSYIMATEPISAGYAVNLGAVGIVGTFLGMPLEALFLGAFGGFLVLGFNPASSRSHGVLSVCVSMVLAGALTPPVAHFAAMHADFGADLPEEVRALSPFVSLTVGAGWQWALPHITRGVAALFQAAIARAISFIDGDKK